MVVRFGAAASEDDFLGLAADEGGDLFAGGFDDCARALAGGVDGGGVGVVGGQVGKHGVEDRGVDGGSGVEIEILNYRIEMDAQLHPSLVELHTMMDYPSYTCKLATTTVQCMIAFEPPNSDTSGQQNAQMQTPFDLFGFHSYGWILSSVVARLRPGQSQVTVHLFLPNEDRYPNAVAEVRRETPDSITITGRTFKAQRFMVKLVMDSSDISSATVWTSRSGLVLKMQAAGEPAPGGDLPFVELTSYKQREGFVPEMQ